MLFSFRNRFAISSELFFSVGAALGCFSAHLDLRLAYLGINRSYHKVHLP